MDDMYWEISTPEGFQPPPWAVGKVKKRGITLYLSMVKGNIRHLDWLGKSSKKDYAIMTCKEITRFVVFDVYSCNLLV